MIPLYGFLEGDCIGLLILAEEEEDVESVREKLKRSASIRVPLKEGGNLYKQDQSIPLNKKVKDTNLKALDRIDVRWERT